MQCKIYIYKLDNLSLNVLTGICRLWFAIILQIVKTIFKSAPLLFSLQTKILLRFCLNKSIHPVSPFRFFTTIFSLLVFWYYYYYYYWGFVRRIQLYQNNYPFNFTIQNIIIHLIFITIYHVVSSNEPTKVEVKITTKEICRIRNDI